jgi:hypothetical protein
LVSDYHACAVRGAVYRVGDDMSARNPTYLTSGQISTLLKLVRREQALAYSMNLSGEHKKFTVIECALKKALCPHLKPFADMRKAMYENT